MRLTISGFSADFMTDMPDQDTDASVEERRVVPVPNHQSQHTGKEIHCTRKVQIFMDTPRSL